MTLTDVFHSLSNSRGRRLVALLTLLALAGCGGRDGGVGIRKQVIRFTGAGNSRLQGNAGFADAMRNGRSRFVHNSCTCKYSAFGQRGSNCRLTSDSETSVA